MTDSCAECLSCTLPSWKTRAESLIAMKLKFLTDAPLLTVSRENIALRIVSRLRGERLNVLPLPCRRILYAVILFHCMSRLGRTGYNVIRDFTCDVKFSREEGDEKKIYNVL